jgi:E3 ubiquitin-protein ligase HERC2
VSDLNYCYTKVKLYDSFSASKRPTDITSTSLARVGSRVAWNFAFAFLRRAWRSGEDTDLCTDLLREALEALSALPEASVFDESSVNPIWLEVITKSEKFLQNVASG